MPRQSQKQNRTSRPSLEQAGHGVGFEVPTHVTGPVRAVQHAYRFDDVTIVPGHHTIDPDLGRVDFKLGRLDFPAPFVAAAIDGS